MFRFAVAAAAASVVGLSALPAAAGAQPTLPPRLTGETLNAQRNWPGTTEPYFLRLCGQWLATPPVTGSGNYTATQKFTLHGPATGPDPGTFTGSGSITTTFPGNITIPPGYTGTVKAFRMNFRITSSAGSITGTERLAGGGGTAQCIGGAGGTAFSTNLKTSFIARTAAGVVFDHGTSTVGLSSEWALAEISQADLTGSFN